MQRADLKRGLGVYDCKLVEMDLYRVVRGQVSLEDQKRGVWARRESERM